MFESPGRNVKFPRAVEFRPDRADADAERLRLLLNVTRIVPWEADFATGQYSYVGDQAVQLLGYAIDEWYEPDFWERHLHPEDRERAVADCIESCNSHENYETENRMIGKDGRVVWLHNLVTVTRERGKPKALRGFSIDITETKQREGDLRRLSGRLIDAQEEERRRIARELHDDLNQRIALLSMELEQLDQKTRKSSRLHRRLKSLQQQVRDISSDIHRLSYKLHPSKLDHLGLVPSVNSLCEELSHQGTLKVEFNHYELPAQLPDDLTLCLFRIVQEALRNCTKHSGATSAKVLLEHAGGKLHLCISDNGCGFDLGSDALRKGLGFTSIRERLRIVDGTLEIDSRPAHGTLLKVSVPLGKQDVHSRHEKFFRVTDVPKDKTGARP